MPRTVLLIEDNAANRYLTTFLLEAAGYRVHAAVDGPTGVALAESLRPDLILLDIQLPGMDGYAVAEALRAREALRATPVIAVTSYAMAGDRDRAIAAGCTGYLEKPIDPDTFVRDIERLAAPGEGEGTR